MLITMIVLRFIRRSMDSIMERLVDQTQPWECRGFARGWFHRYGRQGLLFEFWLDRGE